MSGGRGWIAWVAALAVLAGAGYFAYSRLWAGPVHEAEMVRGRHEDWIAFYEKELGARRKVQDGMKAFRASTLGGIADQVEHRFRTNLNALAEEAGLGGVEVSNRAPEPATNPVGSMRDRLTWPAGLKAKLEKQKDFMVVRGEVKGTGSLEQALRALASVDAQPWVHRVESVGLKPIDKDRERFEVRLGVSSLFIPDPSAKDVPEPARVKPEERVADQWRAIVYKNIFKEPPPPAPVAVAAGPGTPAPPPPPPPTPYGDWRLTGLAESRLGLEAWLFNTRSGEKVTLNKGGKVLDCVFVEGERERAVFELEGQKYEVFTGHTLAERRPMN